MTWLLEQWTDAMNSTNKITDFDEFELDLSGETEARPAADQRAVSRNQTSSSVTGIVECRDQRHFVRINDLSIQGVGVTLDSRLPPNAECRLTLQLAVCGMDYELSMKCRVRHCDAIDSRSYHCGLQFIDMSQGTRDTLLLLIGG
jgi:hypothetical protein